MAIHSRILAGRTPQTEEPGGLQSMGSPRVRYDLATERQKHDDYKEMYYVNHLVEFLIYNADLTVVTIINGFYKVIWEIRGINRESVHITTCDTLS